MPIEFRCAQCGRMLQTSEAMAGRRVLCSGCGAFSVAPSPEGPAPRSPFAPPEPPPADPPPSPPGNPFAPPPPPDDDRENPYRAPTQYGPPPSRLSGEAYGQPTDARAVISFVLGVIGFATFCCCPLIGLPVGLVGLILGGMARHSPSRGLAIAGMVLCGIQLLLSLVYVAFFVIVAIADAL